MLMTLERRVPHWSDASQNDHKSSGCLSFSYNIHLQRGIKAFKNPTIFNPPRQTISMTAQLSEYLQECGFQGFLVFTENI